MTQGPGQVFPQPGAGSAGKGLWLFQCLPEGFGALRQLEFFQLDGAAGAVLPHQHELAQVGDQHQPVTVPIATHLITGCREPCVIVGPFHLHHAPLRNLALAGTTFLHLPGSIQPEIRMAGALVGQLAHTEHPGLQQCAHPVEESGQWTVAGALARGAAGGAHTVE